MGEEESPTCAVSEAALAEHLHVREHTRRVIQKHISEAVLRHVAHQNQHLVLLSR